MPKHPSPLDYWSTGYAMWMTALESQSVIAMRMMGMAGLWNVPPFENTRMISEKPEAFGRAAMAAGLAIATGKHTNEILKDTTKQIRRKTRSNARRLAKRGPKFSR